MAIRIWYQSSGAMWGGDRSEQAREQAREQANSSPPPLLPQAAVASELKGGSKAEIRRTLLFKL